MPDLAVPATHVALAYLAAALIATLARRRDLLDPGGAVAATLLGPALVATGGWWLGLVLIGFFLTAALLPEPDRQAPSRTWRQVLANGGLALAFATAATALGQPILLAGAAATIAAAAADTWATEIGRAYGGTPWSARTFRRVSAGTSGAVSAAGTLASVTGGATIALIALAAARWAPDPLLTSAGVAAIVAGAGLLGSLVDTALGATAQARFACVACGRRSESPAPHAPGHAMRPASGVPWLTNSVVNLAASATAGGVATLLTASVY